MAAKENLPASEILSRVCSGFPSESKFWDEDGTEGVSVDSASFFISATTASSDFEWVADSPKFTSIQDSDSSRVASAIAALFADKNIRQKLNAVC